MRLTWSFGRWLEILRTLQGRMTEHYVMFPCFILLVLAVVWWTTLNLIRVERAAAEHAAVASSRELVETYEAQIVRALREIDQTLKLVEFAYEEHGTKGALAKLKRWDLLPPDLLFMISIVDSSGRLLASNRPENIQDKCRAIDLGRLRHGGEFEISLPWKDEVANEWRLCFSRRLNAAGQFSGAVTLSLDAAYFVSGYESSKLGDHGVLGLLGTDGVFRVRRTGDTTSAGERVDFAATVPEDTDEGTMSRLYVNPWDGMKRHTAARLIYDFPLAVVAGLSMEEQLAATRRNARIYLWRAIAASIVLSLLVLLLWRMSYQLARVRRREAEARVAYAKRVEYLAYHDGLTGLPNRSLFSKLLDQGIVQAHRHERQLAVLFLDLDRFKQINDTLGHDAGDDLLKEVAQRLRTCLRESDNVARMGGDEFVVLVPELEGEQQAVVVANKMLAAVAHPFNLVGQDFRITVSIGISIYPRDGEDEQTLKKNADIAMYKAKEEGRNNYQLYSEQLNANSLQRLTLESDLRRALENSEFELHYQPKQDLRTGRITGMEALLRWRHPDIGLVPPMQFIPLAEETGLILQIGKWVLEAACRQNVAWQKQGLPRMGIAVNLSVRQLSDDNLLSDVAAILKETGMDARLLELEITERMLMRDMDKTMRILKAFKSMGVRVAIDDFGVGYSSLTALQQFPIDTIKIDRSFIRNLSSIEADKDLTAAIIAMGRTLSMTVVAQGVETKEQAELLRNQSCQELQGFYFNQPMPSAQIVELLRAQTHAPA